MDSFQENKNNFPFNPAPLGDLLKNAGEAVKNAVVKPEQPKDRPAPGNDLVKNAGEVMKNIVGGAGIVANNKSDKPEERKDNDHNTPPP